MQNEQLLNSLRAAVNAQPRDASLRLHLARMLLLSGLPAESERHARAVLELDPTNSEGTELLADIVRALDDDEPPAEQPAFDAHSSVEPPREERPGAEHEHTVTLADVAGLDDVKDRLETEFLAPARNPELAARYGKRARGGLLLYGPPGCGKTFIARALAGELDATFIAVSSATVVSALPGQSAQHLSELFEEARRRRPSMLFFDEVDAIAFKREAMTSAAWLRSMVNQFLSELDGFVPNDGVFVVGATNAPWDVDPAMRRPGRFDRTVAVLPPDHAARKGIFESHMRDRPLAADIDLDKLAALTEGFSGADIAHVVEEGSSEAFREAMRSGKEIVVDFRMLKRAVGATQPSVSAWLEQAKNHVLFSNRDGMLDDLAAYMRNTRML